ncbi:OmpA family protein [Flavobacterium tyrosinilyticum]|uniref:OmpA family protein n=1 Tax=Flavobacterium tyrosinilyticum TaxID=1658740 RepID=UPI00202FD13D|nr:OmpA family protein [Flavobacterium tyrosinilyticum]MCM0667248.1 OmpA family protein [Flavobacterium tyrosinilyticum]
MFKKLFYLLGIAATIILGTILYQRFCCSCYLNEQTDNGLDKTVMLPETSPNPFILNGSGINYQCNDSFDFLQNNSALISPVKDSIVMGLENLKEILIANPKQKITITGYATSDEKNTTTFENLALARANDVKTFLVAKGFSESQFDTKGEILDAWKTSGDTLLGPIKFQFSELESEKNTEDWSILKNEINANPLVLYFNTNQSSDNLSKEEHQKVIDIAKYVNHVSDAKVQVVGHSDNTGSRELNMNLAKKRAEFTKKYLVQNGIKNSNIEVSAKGPDEPISDNESAEGRAKNRRTVITIK